MYGVKIISNTIFTRINSSHHTYQRQIHKLTLAKKKNAKEKKVGNKKNRKPSLYVHDFFLSLLPPKLKKSRERIYIHAHKYNKMEYSLNKAASFSFWHQTHNLIRKKRKKNRSIDRISFARISHTQHAYTSLIYICWSRGRENVVDVAVIGGCYCCSRFCCLPIRIHPISQKFPVRPFF